jgi:hypothetical protein
MRYIEESSWKIKIINMEDRIKGERASIATRVTIDASPYSTLNTLKIDQLGTPNFNLRTSTDTSTAKEIITNIEEAIELGRSAYKDYMENCEGLMKDLKRIGGDFTRQIDEVPGSILQHIESMRDSLRESFVNQLEENMRSGKQIAGLVKEKGMIVQGVSEVDQRLKQMEDSFAC